MWVVCTCRWAASTAGRLLSTQDGGGSHVLLEPEPPIRSRYTGGRMYRHKCRQTLSCMPCIPDWLQARSSLARLAPAYLLPQVVSNKVTGACVSLLNVTQVFRTSMYNTEHSHPQPRQHPCLPYDSNLADAKHDVRYIMYPLMCRRQSMVLLRTPLSACLQGSGGHTCACHHPASTQLHPGPCTHRPGSC
jgi:hypothetical protein